MTRQDAIELVILDLDGVIRHFDAAHRDTIEERHGLAAGVLRSHAFAEPLITELVTGKLSRAEWTHRIGEAVGAPEAAAEWLAEAGTIDDDILEVVDELRASGLRVVVLTNGTDTIPAELERFGITDRFDAVFNTADIGFAKPDRRAFDFVLEAMGAAANRTFFADDSAGHVVAAQSLGVTAHHFTGVPGLRAALAQAGLLDPMMFIGCGCLVRDEQGRVLMVRESKARARGRMALPAGKLEFGETIVEAAVRETREETGLDVAVDGLLGVFHTPASSELSYGVNFVFAAHGVGGAVQTSEHHPDVEWLEPAELRALDVSGQLRGRHVLLALEAAEDDQLLPVETVTTTSSWLATA